MVEGNVASALQDGHSARHNPLSEVPAWEKGRAVQQQQHQHGQGNLERPLAALIGKCLIPTANLTSESRSWPRLAARWGMGEQGVPVADGRGGQACGASIPEVAPVAPSIAVMGR